MAPSTPPPPSSTPPPPPPRKVVTYPIASENNAGALFLYGSPASPRIAILCAGYADDHETFQSFGSRLAKEGDCLVGVTCLPGYDDRDDRPYTANKSAGYTFDEMVGGVREAVKALRSESTYSDKDGKLASLIGVFHDWGVAPGSMFANRALEEASTGGTGGAGGTAGSAEDMLVPDKLILFDVLGGPHPHATNVPADRRDTFYEIFVTLAYRTVLATSFGVRRYISKYLAPLVFLPPMIALGVLRLSPILAVDNAVFETRHAKPSLDRMISMAYPYYYMFKSMFTGTMKEDFDGMCLPLDLTKTPVLYMYGTEKRIMFHDRRSVAMLEREHEEGRKSRAVKVEGAGHYLYRQQEDLCVMEAVKFVSDA